MNQQLSLFDGVEATIAPSWQSLGMGWASALFGAVGVLHFWGTPSGWLQTACGQPTPSGGPFSGSGLEFIVSNPPPAGACADCAARWYRALGQEVPRG